MSFENKYNKYKTKYLELKGGARAPLREAIFSNRDYLQVNKILDEYKDVKNGRILFDVVQDSRKEDSHHYLSVIEKLLENGSYVNYIHINLANTPLDLAIYLYPDYANPNENNRDHFGASIINILKKYGGKKFGELPMDAPGKREVKARVIGT